MNDITAYHQIDDTDHYQHVLNAMVVLGAPTVRAVDTCHGLVALEGSNRLAAASELGLVPTVEVIDTLPPDIADELELGDATLDDVIESISRYPYDLGETYHF